MNSDTPLLRGCHVLVVEDEFFIADDMAQTLTANGAKVIGPAPTLELAMKLLATERVDCAVIDVNLRGRMAYPLADELRARRVPFVFATGYDPAVVPPAYQDVPRWLKPYSLDELMQSLPELVRIAEASRT